MLQIYSTYSQCRQDHRVGGVINKQNYVSYVVPVLPVHSDFPADTETGTSS
jgi:hypothetical protein